MAGQHRATRRQALRSALAHKKAADQVLAAINSLQASWNGTMDKLDADTDVALDTDYVASAAAVTPINADVGIGGAQHKATLRQALRSALAHKKLADEIIETIAESATAYAVMLAKLDAEAGTLAATDWVATAGVSVVNPDDFLGGAQHKATLRVSLRSALANKSLADDILAALSELQTDMNASLAALDAGSVNGAHAAFKVTVLDPDA